MSYPSDEIPPITFTTEAYQNEYALTYPICGDFYVSPTLVEVTNVQGRTTYTITAEGMQNRDQQSPQGRGVIITHGYQCERGRNWITRAYSDLSHAVKSSGNYR